MIRECKQLGNDTKTVFNLTVEVNRLHLSPGLSR